MYIIFIFSFHIYTFRSSFLSWEPLNFRFGPESRAQWQTCCRSTNTFFIVHHLHSFIFPFHIYTLFSSFLSWGPKFPILGPYISVWGPTISEPSGRFADSSFLSTYTFFSSFIYWGPLNLLSCGAQHLRLGLTKILGRPQWQTCYRTTNIFFIVHHLHYFHHSFPYIHSFHLS